MLNLFQPKNTYAVRLIIMPLVWSIYEWVMSVMLLTSLLSGCVINSTPEWVSVMLLTPPLSGRVIDSTLEWDITLSGHVNDSNPE